MKYYHLPLALGKPLKRDLLGCVCMTHNENNFTLWREVSGNYWCNSHLQKRAPGWSTGLFMNILWCDVMLNGWGRWRECNEPLCWRLCSSSVSLQWSIVLTPRRILTLPRTPPQQLKPRKDDVTSRGGHPLKLVVYQFYTWCPSQRAPCINLVEFNLIS